MSTFFTLYFLLLYFNEIKTYYIIGIYFDFESLLVPTNTKKSCECRFNCKCESASSLDVSNHRPIIYSLVVMNMNKEILFEHEDHDINGNVHINFLDYLLDIEEELLDHASKMLLLVT